MKGNYEKFQAFKAVKNKAKQSQFVPESEPVQAIPKACGFEAATRPLWLRVDLKKQSQSKANTLAFNVQGSEFRVKIRKRLFEKTKPIFERTK